MYAIRISEQPHVKAGFTGRFPALLVSLMLWMVLLLVIPFTVIATLVLGLLGVFVALACWPALLNLVHLNRYQSGDRRRAKKSPVSE